MNYCSCCSEELVRGTTPSYIVNFSTCEINVSDISSAFLTINQYGVSRDFSENLMLYNDENVVAYRFTQEETLSFSVGKLKLQLDVITKGGERCVADRRVINVSDTLKDEVI